MKPIMKSAQRLADGEVEHEEAAGEHERDGDEVDRDLRRQLVGEADHEVDDQRIDDERALICRARRKAPDATASASLLRLKSTREAAR